MKLINFKISMPPYSVNKYFYGNRSIKRREAVEWERKIVHCLDNKEIQINIEQLRKTFDVNKHCFKVDLIFTYPKELIYTKKNVLSSRAFDLSNVEKPLIDVIFLKKYSTDLVRNVEIDDKYIVKMSSEKNHSENSNHYIEITIEILDLPNF